MESLGDVIIDGATVTPSQAAVSVFDVSVQRGYGCFEALRAYRGRVFRLAPHLDRLEISAAKLGIALPSRDDIGSWVQRQAAHRDCVVRVIVTGGTSLRNPGTESRVIVIAEPVPARPEVLSVFPVPAPWHSDGAEYELTGAKTLSYAPNVAAALAAMSAGFDDALLIGRSHAVLEGPTYSVGWIRNGVFETPSIRLGILASITRAAAFEVAVAGGLDVVEDEYPLDRLLGATEVFAMSTVKEITPIGRIGDQGFPPGPVTASLAAGFRALVARELEL